MVSATPFPVTGSLSFSLKLLSGNCLFASLSDQLCGTPAKHIEIRLKIIEHMRTLRPLYEQYVHRDDVQQRRLLRSAALGAQKESDDAFEDYLLLMSKSGTYGGEPELVAFCQAYDQDVTVHLPVIQGFERDSILYTNEHRETDSPKPSLHICYGGDEITRAHYDSARNRDGSHPRGHNSPLPEALDSRRNSGAGAFSSTPPGASLSARAIRNSRSDLSSEMIHELLQNGRRDMEGTLDQLNVRARSSSVSSSHRSSSSKRSLEDEGDHFRRTKRADRRKSTRKRTDMAIVSVDPDTDFSFRLHIESPHPDTPASTQDTEDSSEPAEPEPSEDGDGDYQPAQIVEEASDSESSRVSKNRRLLKPSLRTPVAILPKRTPSSTPGIGVSMAERPRSTLRS
jgi:OTU domain-containing protein 3